MFCVSITQATLEFSDRAELIAPSLSILLPNVGVGGDGGHKGRGDLSPKPQNNYFCQKT